MGQGRDIHQALSKYVSRRGEYQVLPCKKTVV